MHVAFDRDWDASWLAQAILGHDNEPDAAQITYTEAVHQVDARYHKGDSM